MGVCRYCTYKFTLNENEYTCDACGKIVKFKCWNCENEFELIKENEEKIKSCKVCGFFYCPTCGVCANHCNKINWKEYIKKILKNNISNEQLEKIILYIESLRFQKEELQCPLRKIPISYAKSRIKTVLAKGEGFRVKSKFEQDKFDERMKKYISMPIGVKKSINEVREIGRYGQEERDILNALVCSGFFKINLIATKNKMGKDISYYTEYERINGIPCEHFDRSNIIIKKCPSCQSKKDIKRKEKIYSRNQEFCDYCINKKGERIKLKEKVSNKDICQLHRKKFIKSEVKKEDGTGQEQSAS